MGGGTEADNKNSNKTIGPVAESKKEQKKDKVQESKSQEVPEEPKKEYSSPSDVNKWNKEAVQGIEDSELEQIVQDMDERTLKKLRRTQLRGIQEKQNVEYLVETLHKDDVKNLSREQIRAVTELAYVQKIIDGLPDLRLADLSERQVQSVNGKEKITQLAQRLEKEQRQYLTTHQIVEVEDTALVKSLYDDLGQKDSLFSAKQLNAIKDPDEYKKQREEIEVRVLREKGNSRLKTNMKAQAKEAIWKAKNFTYWVFQFVNPESKPRDEAYSEFIAQMIQPYLLVVGERTNYSQVVFGQTYGKQGLQIIVEAGQGQMEKRDFVAISELPVQKNFRQSGILRKLDSMTYIAESVRMNSDEAERVMSQLAKYEWAPETTLGKKITELDFDYARRHKKQNSEGESYNHDLTGKLAWKSSMNLLNKNRHYIEAEVSARKSVREVLQMYEAVPQVLNSTLDLDRVQKMMTEREVSLERKTFQIKGLKESKIEPTVNKESVETNIVVGNYRLPAMKSNRLEF